MLSTNTYFEMDLFLCSTTLVLKNPAIHLKNFYGKQHHSNIFTLL